MEYYIDMVCPWWEGRKVFLRNGFVWTGVVQRCRDTLWMEVGHGPNQSVSRMGCSRFFLIEW
jgi:hypothetical protein